MPKSKNAFALRDFDADKILSRNFFDNLIGADGRRLFPKNIPDNEILKMFAPDKTDDASSIEEKRRAVDRIIFCLQEYCTRIMRHSDRLLKISCRVQKSNLIDAATKKVFEKRIKILMRVEYSDIHDFAGRLLRRTVLLKQKLDGTLDRRKFGEKLKQARADLGVSQAALANLLALYPTDVANFELGNKFPSMDNFLKILRVTHKSADWFLSTGKTA